jgi:hypothetical protein
MVSAEAISRYTWKLVIIPMLNCDASDIGRVGRKPPAKRKTTPSRDEALAATEPCLPGYPRARRRS